MILIQWKHINMILQSNEHNSYTEISVQTDKYTQ